MTFHIVQRIELTAIVLALAAALGLVVAVLLTGRWTNSEAALTPATRTVTAATPTAVRTVTTHETVTVVAGQEVPPDGQPPELRYLVKPGDTLWDIAAANYDDIGGGMRTIRLRNGLKRQKVLAGEVLVIPLEGGGDPR